MINNKILKKSIRDYCFVIFIFFYFIIPICINAKIVYGNLIYDLDYPNSEYGGEICFSGTKFNGIYPRELDATNYLDFYIFDLNGNKESRKTYSSNEAFYEPSIGWNGNGFGIAYSTIGGFKFMIIAPNGDIQLNPVSLPNIPIGVKARTAAPKVIWTGYGYAVFGLVLVPEYINQPADTGYWYNYLFYWFIDPYGNVLVAKNIKDLTGITYPKYRGQERGWYDAVWASGSFFVTYLDEIPGNPPLPGAYCAMLDISGNFIKPEYYAFSAIHGYGAQIAYSGASYAITAIDSPASNQTAMYVRFYDLSGNPLGNEINFLQASIGIVKPPTVSWLGDKFVIGYAYVPNEGYATYTAMMLTTYSYLGNLIDSGYLFGTVEPEQVASVGNYMKIVGDGDKLLFSGQRYEILLGKVYPLIYNGVGDVNIPFPPIIITPPINNNFQDNGIVPFQWLPVAKSNNYTLQLADNPQFNNPLYNNSVGNVYNNYLDLSLLNKANGINPGTKLYWRIKGSSSDYSQAYSFVVDPNIWIDPLTINITIPKQSKDLKNGKDMSLNELVLAKASSERNSKLFIYEKKLNALSLEPVKIYSLNAQGTPQYIRGKFSINKKDMKIGVKEFLNDIKSVIGISDTDNELYEIDEYKDEIGCIHLRYQQIYEGIPIWKTRLQVHIDKKGYINAINGNTFPTPNKKISKSISSDDALKIARDTARHYSREAVSELVWYPSEEGLNLAYKINLLDGIHYDSTYLVDANTGRVFTYFSNLQTSYPGTYETGSGTTSLGQSQSVPLYKYNNLYQPVIRTDWYDNSDPLNYKILNDAGGIMREGMVEYNKHGAILILNSSKWVPGNRYSAELFNFTSTSINETMVSDFAYVFPKILNFYNTNWGWRSWDNKGSGITIFSHLPNPSDGKGYDNAYYSPNGYFAFGDTSDQTKFRIFSAPDDIVAHEFTHGVTDSTSKLIYQYMSGAINESMSDIIPQGIDTQDWLIGEDLLKVTDDNLKHVWVRSMEDPTWGGTWDPSHPEKGGQPAHMNNYFLCGPSTDNGGVHINSGIINKAAYEFALKTSRDTMVKVFFRANTVYLTPESQFIDVRRACIQAAIDLFPGQSNMVTSVQQAFDAVGLTEPGNIAGPTLNTPANRTAVSGKVTFSWSAITNAKYYILELSGDIDFQQGSGVFPIGVYDTPTPPTTYEISNLGLQGFKWYWRVRSDQSAFSEVREFVYGNTFAEGIAHTFMINSQGASSMTVKGITKQNNAAWLSVVTDPMPNQIISPGNMMVQIIINPTGLSAGQFTEKLIINSSMTTRNPYPNGVNINLTIQGSTPANIFMVH